MGLHASANGRNSRIVGIRMVKKTEIKKMLAKLKRSEAFKIAYHDDVFMEHESLRPVRLQLELLKPEMILQEENIKSTIVVFGGTRIVEPKHAERDVKSLEKKLAQKPDDKALKKKLQIAKSVLRKSPYYNEAKEFARLVSAECQINEGHEYVIVTGGGPGIMEAANRGAFEIGAKSIGLNITLPLEQEPNPYITPELCLQFHYFAIRKMHFMMRAKALLAFPGGYGTMDELFEALTLVQTQKVEPLPVILFGEKFWRKIVNFQALVDEGTIAEEDIELFVYADSAKEAWEYIKYFNQSGS